MQTIRLLLALAAFCALLIGCYSIAIRNAAAAGQGRSDLSAATRQELAKDCSTTAWYDDIAQAIDDGYVDSNLYVPGIGIHLVMLPLIDATGDPAQPEMTLHSLVQGENRLGLAGMVYLVRLNRLHARTGEGDHSLLKAE